MVEAETHVVVVEGQFFNGAFALTFSEQLLLEASGLIKANLSFFILTSVEVRETKIIISGCFMDQLTDSDFEGFDTRFDVTNTPLDYSQAEESLVLNDSCTVLLLFVSTLEIGYALFEVLNTRQA